MLEPLSKRASSKTLEITPETFDPVQHFGNGTMVNCLQEGVQVRVQIFGDIWPPCLSGVLQDGKYA